MGTDCAYVIMQYDQEPVYTYYRLSSHLPFDDGMGISCSLYGTCANPEMESFFSHLRAEGCSLLLGAETVTLFPPVSKEATA